MEVSGQFQAAAALPVGKQNPVPIVYKAEWVWTLRGREHFPYLNQNFGSSIIQPVAPSLYRLSYRRSTTWR
jgi:hypothetical protein